MSFPDLKPSNQKTPAAKPAVFHGRVPTKESINFAAVGVRRMKWWLVLLALVLIFAAAFAVGKFLVYDQIDRVSAAQAKVADLRSQIDECNDRIAGYGELNDVYAHYTYSGMTEEELARVDRSDVMELLERVVAPRTDVSDWTLEENRLTLSVAGDTLQTINETVQALLEEPMVSYCEVNTATSDASAYRRLNRISSDKVVADVVIYLRKTEEVAAQ